MEGVVNAYVLVILFQGCTISGYGDLTPCLRDPEKFATIEACKARAEEFHAAKEMLNKGNNLFRVPTFEYSCQTMEKDAAWRAYFPDWD
jgi:hypothetical protein